MTAPKENIRILLVDDHPLVRDGLRARLETIPHFAIVGEADNPDGALLAATAQSPTLVLMDINLNGGNGIDLTARFHAEHPDVAILMLTMHDKAEYVIQAIRAGARGYVLKDAPAQDIITAIETVMQGGIYYSAGLSKELARPLPPSQLLTPREREVLRRIGAGMSNKRIAEKLSLSVRTVETHRLNIKRKLDIDGQADLIRFAVEQQEFL